MHKKYYGDVGFSGHFKSKNAGSVSQSTLEGQSQENARHGRPVQTSKFWIILTRLINLEEKPRIFLEN